MKTIDIIAACLLVIGGLNWGLWGLFDLDVVATVFGGFSTAAARIISVLVGAAALYQALSVRAIQTRWHLATPA
ncbi:MAG: DUF378 domain-containing protein [Phycisphaerales bacterium]|nr:DUF378 domain-containing protein [Phycisphaerales bacterium]